MAKWPHRSLSPIGLSYRGDDIQLISNVMLGPVNKSLMWLV